MSEASLPVAATRGRQHQTFIKGSIFNRDQDSLVANCNDANDEFNQNYLGGSWAFPVAQCPAFEVKPGLDVPDQWSNDGSQCSPVLSLEDPQPMKIMYPNALQLDSIHSSDACGFFQPVAVPPGYQSQFVDQISGHQNNYISHIPPYIQATPPNCEHLLGMFQPAPHYSLVLNQQADPMWLNSTYMSQKPINTIINNASTTVQSARSPLKLYWPSERNEIPVSAPKRKRTSPEPSNKRSHAAKPEKPLSEFVVVFENSPGALLGVKHRRKLDDPVRKAARDVRKAGACHQCRFRKRTCSTGSPCISCLKNGNGLHEVKCQRESPFVGKLMHQYFMSSSTKRVLSFKIKYTQTSQSSYNGENVTIDGIGRTSHPIKLRVRRTPLNGLPAEEQETIKRVMSVKNIPPVSDDFEFILLEDDNKCGKEVEQWAMEYTSKFVHAAGPEFHSTTIAQILGTAYVKKNLPESQLVSVMLRVSSLAFVLRAGVRCSNSDISRPGYYTVQASIDTILYERLQLAEKELFQMLQRLIFRTAGCLTRGQIFPVALVLWQLMRFLSLSSSHLSNIVQKFRPQAQSQADYQFIGLRLLLSTHMALFRSSNPLLLDINDKHNRDLIGGDDELANLCAKMRNVVLNFREKGAPEMKGSIAYKKEYFDLFRKVYTGL